MRRCLWIQWVMLSGTKKNYQGSFLRFNSVYEKRQIVFFLLLVRRVYAQRLGNLCAYVIVNITGRSTDFTFICFAGDA
jgi:hypothetical protein